MSYVFLDIETTGLDSETCFITEVGAVVTDEYGNVLGSLNCYVELPEGEVVPEFITELTGITTEDLLEHGIPIESAMTYLKHFIGESIVVAQYAPFDFSFIEKHFEIANFYDTRTMAYALDLPSAKLDGIAAHYGIEMAEHHRAVSDANTCKDVFFKMVDDFANSGLSAGTLMNVVGTKPERMPKIYPTNTRAVVDYGEKEGE